MIDTETKRKLRQMGVPEMVVMIESIERDPSYANLTFDERMKMIVDYADQEKENASVKRLLSRAHLRVKHADISNIIYDGRPLSRDTVNTLGTCQFVDTSTDVIIEGFTGTGKSHLACAIGKQACKHGISTLYLRMPDLLMLREEGLSAGSTESKLLKKYARYKVLAIDEWLIDPLSKDQMRFMLELIDRRHDSSSTIFCSQYKVEDWHARMGGGVHADAIMDRIIHNAVTVRTGEVNMRLATSPKKTKS
jgi:DNA replication protein DnaC